MSLFTTQTDYLHRIRLYGPRAGEEWLLALQIEAFAKRASQRFSRRFLSLAHAYTRQVGDTGHSVFKVIHKYRFDLPTFDVYFNVGREVAMAKLIPERPTYLWPHTALLVWNFPKPVSQYWWKRGKRFAYKDRRPINGMALEWGYFYHVLRNFMWIEISKEEGNGELRFERVNRKGEHVPQHYYYLWQVGLAEHVGWSRQSKD